MVQPNYFKQESDRMLYGTFEEASTPVILGFAKNESWNIENITYFQSRDENNEPVDDAGFDFMVGNIRKFAIKGWGVYIDQNGTPTRQLDIRDVLDFFLIP